MQIVVLQCWLRWWRPDGWHFSAVAAIVVGVSAALGVALFKWLIELLTRWFGVLAAWAAPLGPLAIVLVPVLGGLLVGLIAHYWIGPERHHGVAGILESVALAGGRLRFWRVPAKVLGSALSIGSGAAVGPEDPSVQIGSNLGSAVGQLLRMPDARTRVLVAAGAAAGVGAAFNAPIAGVFFAIEIILGELGGGSLGVVLLAAVISAATTQAIAGPEPAFSVGAYEYHSREGTVAAARRLMSALLISSNIVFRSQCAPVLSMPTMCANVPEVVVGLDRCRS